MCKSLRVLVTRTADQADALNQKLRAAGFTPVEFPAIQLKSLPWEPLDAALGDLLSFEWLIFTSGNAVAFFLRRFDALRLALNTLPRVAAVGSATAQLLEARGIPIAYMPAEFVGTALVRGLGKLSGKKVLLPRAKIGRPEIAELLQSQGAELVEVPLYDTVTAVPTPTAWEALNKGFNVITFTSPSSVRNFSKIIANSPKKLAESIKKQLDQATVICIGPVTAETAVELGFTNILVPEKYTIDGIVQQLKERVIEVDHT